MKQFKANYLKWENNRYKIARNQFILVSGEGIIEKISDSAIEEYNFEDKTEYLMIPSFTDIHLHAPQFPNMGVGYDKELLDWLNDYTFPLESRYQVIEFAKKQYIQLIKKLWLNGILRSVIFGTIDLQSNMLLSDLLEQSGMISYVGKVNMDQNAPAYYIEETKESLHHTQMFIEYLSHKNNVFPIITPRFAPTCSKKLLKGLGDLARKYQLSVQSHLSENRDEIAWVKDLFKESLFYADVYDRYGLLDTSKIIMAHCVYSPEEEQDLLKKKNVLIAHCPTSNFNVSSGLAPISHYLNKNLRIGLASDISGGHTLNFWEIMRSALMANHMRYVYFHEEKLDTHTVLRMMFENNGEFFEKTGILKPGYYFDVLSLKVYDIRSWTEGSDDDVLEFLIYEADYERIEERYLKGTLIHEPFTFL